MHDEATVQYFEAFEALETGYHFIQDTFGISPHVYWPIDVFGHAAYTPTLARAYGFDVIFISRIGTDRKQMMRDKKEMHFFWEGHPNGDTPKAGEPRTDGVFVNLIQSNTYGVTGKL
jgi:hypothetical protein